MKLLYDKNYPKTAYGIEFFKKQKPWYKKDQWYLIIYFYKWYRVFSNYPI